MTKVNIVTLTVTREAPPKAMRSLGAENLRNLQSVITPEQAVQTDHVDIEYWPPVNVSQSLGWNKKFGDEILTPVPETKVTNVTYAILTKNAGEIQAVRDDLKSQVYTILEGRENGNITMGDGSVLNIKDALLLLEKVKSNSKPGRKNVTKEGGHAIETPATISAMDTEVDDFVQALRDRAYDLYEAINSATSQAAWDAIDINAGWPV